MASLRLRDINSLEEYEIRVGVYTSVYTRDSSGNVTAFDSEGTTLLLSSGDVFTDVIPYDKWVTSEFEFVNLPNIRLKATGINSTTFNGAWQGQTGLPNDRVTFTVRYATLTVQYNNGSIGSIGTIFDVSNDTKDSIIYPIGNYQVQPMVWSIALDIFEKETFMLLNPYIYKIVNPFDNPLDPQGKPLYPNWSLTNMFLERNGRMVPEDLKHGTFTLRNYVTDIDIYPSRTRIALPAATSELVGQSVVSNANLSSSFWGRLQYRRTFMKVVNGSLVYCNAYEWMDWLLNDKDFGNDPYPPKEDPDNPTNPDKPPDSPPFTGGDGSYDDNSDPVDITPPPDIDPIDTGSVRLYKMPAERFKELQEYMWTNPKFIAMAQLFTNPMEAVLNVSLIPLDINTPLTDDIVIGNVNTGIQAYIVGNAFTQIDFGEIQLDPYYGDSDDYDDTVINIYLPFYGYQPLNNDDVLGAKLHLVYNVDLITGSFVAQIKVTKTINGTNLSSVMYQINGNMAYKIPTSAQDASTLVNGVLGLLTGHASLSDFKVRQENQGTIAANMGLLSVRKAYVTIARPIHQQPSQFKHYIGYPYEGYVSLSSCSGFTKCREVFIDKVMGTPMESDMIRQALMEGVLL